MTSLEKAIVEADEKVGLILMLKWYIDSSFAGRRECGACFRY